jgi:hypothetical protein
MECSGECPATFGERQALVGGMNPRATPRHRRGRIRDDLAISRYEPAQCGS